MTRLTDTARVVHTPLRTPELGREESWELQVHCRGPLAYLWDDSLDGEFESPQARRSRHRKAAQVCATCPARSACAVAASQTPRAEGIWAGTLIGGSRPLMVPGRPCLRCERPLIARQIAQAVTGGVGAAFGARVLPPMPQNLLPAGGTGVTTYTIILDLTRPLMTSNEQRRAHWTKVRDTKWATELSVCNVLRRRGDVAVTPPVDVHLTWYVPDARRRDSDSLGPCLKACLDALVKAGVIPDDSSEYVRRSGCSVVVDRADPRIELTINEVEAE